MTTFISVFAQRLERTHLRYITLVLRQKVKTTIEEKIVKSSCAIKSSIYWFTLEVQRKLKLGKLLRTNQKTRFRKALFLKGKFEFRIWITFDLYSYLCSEFNDIHRLSFWILGRFKLSTYWPYTFSKPHLYSFPNRLENSIQKDIEKTSTFDDFSKFQLRNLKTQGKVIESWCLFDVYSGSFGINFEDEGG